MPQMIGRGQFVMSDIGWQGTELMELRGERKKNRFTCQDSGFSIV
jgi:hypothetical protein